MFLELLGAVAGGMYGLYAASEKERYATQAAKQSELMYDASKKAYQSAKSGAAMALTIGAMRNADRNRASAIEAFQSESELEAAAAVSGVSSGGLNTVADVAEVRNRLAIDRQAEQGQYELASTKLQGDASVAASLVNMASSLFQYQEAGAEAEYAKSSLAKGLSLGSGILGGISAGAGIEKSLYQVGALSDTGDGFLQKAANKIVGLFQAPTQEGPKVNVQGAGGAGLQNTKPAPSLEISPLMNVGLTNPPSTGSVPMSPASGLSMNRPLADLNRGAEVSGLSALVGALYSENLEDRFTPRWTKQASSLFGSPLQFM